MLRGDEVDLSFADFSSAGRPETARSEYPDFKESPNYAESWCAGRESNPRPSGSKPATGLRKNKGLGDSERE